MSEFDGKTALAAMPGLRRRGGGAIVAISSVQAFAAQERVAAYRREQGGYRRPVQGLPANDGHEPAAFTSGPRRQ